MIWFLVIMICFPETRKSNPLNERMLGWHYHPAKAGKNREAETTGMIPAPIYWRTKHPTSLGDADQITVYYLCFANFFLDQPALPICLNYTLVPNRLRITSEPCRLLIKITRLYIYSASMSRNGNTLN
jgi:hypothetical protein